MSSARTLVAPARLARACAIAAALAASMTSSGARAEHPTGTRPAGAKLALGRRQAARLGATQGPSVGLARAPRAAIAEARRVANPLVLVPPQVSLSVGQRSGAWGSGMEIGVTAMQQFSTGGLGKQRKRTADALADVNDGEVDKARLDDAERASLAWIDLAEAQQTLALRQEALAEAERLVSAATARVKSGAGQPIEVATAEGERGAARAAVLDAEGMETEARAALRYALGLGPDVEVEAVGELGAAGEAPVDAQAAVRSAEEHHPDLAVASARARLARQEEKLTSATHAPWIGVGASFLREGTGDRIWTGVVSVPIPLVSAGAFDRARDRAAADRAAAEVERTKRELARDVRLALHEREHAREVRAATLSGARAPLAEAYRLAKVGYDAGTQDLSAVLLARQRLLAADEQVLRSSADVERADVRFARASGGLAAEVAR